MNKIAKLYFSKTPAVVCTAGSYIALVNEAAMPRFPHFCEGQYLFDSMDPWDVLKYEATFVSPKDRGVLSFSLFGSIGYKYATAVFERIMGRRFAIVYLGNDLQSLPGGDDVFDDGPPDKSTAVFIAKLVSLSDDVFDKEDRLGLMDLRDSVGVSLSAIGADIDCRVTVTENEEAQMLDVIPVNVPLNSFLQMGILLLSVLSHISVSREIEIKINCCNDVKELRLSTDSARLKKSISHIDGLIEEFPSVAVLLSVCNYVAGCTGCGLSAYTDIENERVCLVLGLCEPEVERVDFKSRDPYRYMEKELSFVRKYTSGLLR